MYLVKQSCIVFSMQIVHKENILSKKKIMHRAVAKTKILAQEMGQKKILAG